MIIIRSKKTLQKYTNKYKKQSLSVGFVPTMGALHNGHLSLISTSQQQNNITVCSIFVNPTQFNNKKDFEKYPTTIDTDIEKLEKTGTDILFLPSVVELYPNGVTNLEYYELGYLETILEGKYRPGHFQGVCQVMYRLLNMVQPHNLYMGQKDYQQCMVVKKLLEIMQSNIQLHPCPTLRENDGLAMSSRNMRLNVNERKLATAISTSLNNIKNNIKKESLQNLIENETAILQQQGFMVDYVALANANDLKIIDDWDGELKLVALIAAYLNEVRLIDNMLVN